MNDGVEMIGDELRNAVAFWRARARDKAILFPLPSALTWTFEQGLIVEGQVLGVLHWPDASETLFIAPRGCHGAIVDTGDQFDTELFHRDPPQFLLRFHR
jgi:hypothetical protein